MWPFRSKAQPVETETKASIGETHYVMSGKSEYAMKDWKSYANEGYSANPTIYRCISLIAQNFAKVPLYIKNSEGEIQQDHPLAMLLERPNPDEGGVEFRTASASWYLLTGNNFMEVIKAGDSAQLWNYQPYEMSVKGAGQMPNQYTFMKGKPQEKNWDVDIITGESPILHWRTFTPSPQSPRFGQSPLSAAARAGDTYNAGTEWRYNALKNGGAVKGILGFPEADNKQVEGLKDVIAENFSGERNANKIGTINTKVDWQQLSMNMKDADWLAGSKLNGQEIASVYGVPTQMLGIEGSQTFANYEQARMSFWIDTVMPILDLYASEMTRFFKANFDNMEGYEVCYQDEDIEALEPQRKDKRAELLATEVLSLNEKREVIGYDPIDEPDADAIFVDPNKIPLGLDVFGEDEKEEEAVAKELMRQGVDQDTAEKTAYNLVVERKSVRKK
jgi:HK97 family phage portal protein